MNTQHFKHPNHSHYFIIDGFLHEMYNTIRGERCCTIAPVDDEDLIVERCDDTKANEIYANYRLNNPDHVRSFI